MPAARSRAYGRHWSTGAPASRKFEKSLDQLDGPSVVRSLHEDVSAAPGKRQTPELAFVEALDPVEGKLGTWEDDEGIAPSSARV
jgi:hypothetical protein